MSSRGKLDDRKKSKYNFWSEKFSLFSPTVQTYSEGIGSNNASVDTVNNLQDSGFQRTLKKFKTSSLRVKKNTEVESSPGLKMHQTDTLIHDTNMHCSLNISPQNGSPADLIGVSQTQNKDFNSNPKVPLLSGIGFLGNMSLFHSTALSRSSSYLLSDEVTNGQPTFNAHSNQFKSKHKSKGVYESPSTKYRSSSTPLRGIESREFSSNAHSLISNISHDKQSPDSNGFLYSEPVSPLEANCTSTIFETLEIVAEAATSQNSSPESLSDGAVWKPRVDEACKNICKSLSQQETQHWNIQNISNENIPDLPCPSSDYETDDVFHLENMEMLHGCGVCSRNPSSNFSTDTPPPRNDEDESTTPGFHKGWESRVDHHGRVFYINHIDKTTSWTKPPSDQSCRCCSSSALSPNPTYSADFSCQAEKQIQPPAVVFIIRPDFYTMLRKKQEALQIYNQSPTLKHMINKIRKDNCNFNKYQHNRDLVAFLNLFSDKTKRLPTGWEMIFDKSSREFFIDHSTRNTTFVDPRLPTATCPHFHESILNPSVEHGEAKITKERHTRSLSAPRTRNRALSPDILHHHRHHHHQDVQSLHPAYSEKVVSFLSQSNVMDIIVEKQPHVVSNIPLKNKLHLIPKQGTEALHRFSDDLDLNMLLSQFEMEIMSYGKHGNSSSRVPKSKSFVKNSLVHSLSDHPSNLLSCKPDFPTKLSDFYRKLEYKGYATGPWKIRLEIERERILEDSFKKVTDLTKKEMHRSKLLVSFSGEDGLDYGGPSKEFFFLLSRALFSPYYGLFEYSSVNSYTLQISPMSIFLENYQDWFRFAGRVIGLAILHQHLLDVFFVRPFYKALLKELITLSDLETLDYEYYRSLQWIRDGDGIDFHQLGLTFTVDEEIAGKITEVELKPNGGKSFVTHRNRKDYIDRIVKWRVMRGIKEQTEHIIKGFYEVLDHRLISKFDAHELEFVISGTAEIDIEDWRRNTDYRNGYHDGHLVIEWFWSVVDSYSNERRLRLLQFVTGTSSVPHEGFAALRGYNGPKRFSIEKWGEVSSLPRAHTCFNRLDLPPYTSRQVAYQKLTIAIEETSTYGIE